MTEKTVTVRNAAGIHCRPSSVIISAVQEFPDCVFEVVSATATTELDSILSLLSLGLQKGDSVTIRATGPNEEAACEKLMELFAYEFDFPPR